MQRSSDVESSAAYLSNILVLFAARPSRPGGRMFFQLQGYTILYCSIRAHLCNLQLLHLGEDVLCTCCNGPFYFFPLTLVLGKVMLVGKFKIAKILPKRRYPTTLLTHVHPKNSRKKILKNEKMKKKNPVVFD